MKTDGYVATAGVDAIKLELQNDGRNANTDTECMNLGYLLSRETTTKASLKKGGTLKNRSTSRLS